jgi:hypothetical protein
VSRIRQIKPSWFLDKELRRGTSADAREFYIGLWMLADDGGYLTWDIERIAAELYPYDGVSRRERLVASWADSLETLNAEEPHLVIYSCGHGRVPKMPAHQRIAGKQSVGVWEAHKSCRNAVSRRRLTVAIGVGEPTMATDSPGREIGTERNGTVVVGATEFQTKVPRDKALGRAS